MLWRIPTRISIYDDVIVVAEVNACGNSDFGLRIC